MQNKYTQFIQTAEQKQFGLYGVHIYKQGETVFQHRFRSDDRENLYSGSKTFTAVGVGIAEKEGLIKLSDCVLDYFPEYKAIAAPGAEKITVRHLLQMSSGHEEEDIGLFNFRERAKLFFETPLIHEPGKVFCYENQCSYMLGRIIEKITGLNMRNYLKPRLFDKLGIVNPQWHTCSEGHTLCSSGLYLKTEEYARIGILLLQNGVYKEQDILPKDYIDRMATDLVETSYREDEELRLGYGYQVWKCSLPNSLRADGMYGQLSVVLRDQNTVVTVTGHCEENPKDILRAIWDMI